MCKQELDQVLGVSDITKLGNIYSACAIISYCAVYSPLGQAGYLGLRKPNLLSVSEMKYPSI